jgi:signal transduction histidine kinase
MSEATSVLLVEDNPADSELVLAHLAYAIGHAFRVVHVNSLAAATEALAASSFDAVLLDLSLSDGHGLDTLATIRDAAPETAVVVLTGLDNEEMAFKAVKEGAQDYLVKGRFSADWLVRAVLYAVERRRVVHAQRRLAEELIRREEAERGRLEAERLNRTLDETNRGILALYSELDEKSDSLRRAAEVKSHIVSNVSHEFRTPLNSILGLTRLLLMRTDGPLTGEQEKQLGFIQRSAQELSEMVDDLLDLSRIEAGKVRLHVMHVAVSDLFAAMRGMVRPLRPRGDVAVILEDPAEPILLETDDGKISQILRNLISNALKFTEHGEITLRARADGLNVVFTVSDTGIGIADEDHDRIFEEFSQIDGPLQREAKGTGLGLPLSRRLAELLGGILTVESTPGQGSTFTLTVPSVHPEVSEMAMLRQRSDALESTTAPILVLEDDRQTVFIYEKFLRSSGFRVLAARSVEEARALLQRVRPVAVILDIMLDGETSWHFLGELKNNPETRDIPVLVVTVTDREQKARALGADEFWMKPLDEQWLLKKLGQISACSALETVLVIDDDEVSRYLVRRLLAETPYRLVEARDGREGVTLARSELPSLILLDFVMPGMSAFEVLDELKRYPETRDIPVIVHTSKSLGKEERERLARETADVLHKQNLSRDVALGRIRDALKKAGIASSQAK